MGTFGLRHRASGSRTRGAGNTDTRPGTPPVKPPESKDRLQAKTASGEMPCQSVRCLSLSAGKVAGGA